jgi:hypothetical protein
MFDTLTVEYFVLHRIYKNGEIIWLSTYPELSKYYINHNITLLLLNMHMITICGITILIM